MRGQADSRRGWAFLLLLFVLLAILATLQTRWLSEASRAQRERALAAMQGAAERFALDFDREISRVYLALQSDPRRGDLSPRALAGELDRWQSDTAFPSLIDEIFLLDGSGSDIELLLFDRSSSRFSPLGRESEPPGLRDEIERWRAGRDGKITSTSPLGATFPTLPALPGVLIPRIDPAAPHGRRSRDAQPKDFLVVRLSRAAIARDLVPSLTARHFPSPLWEGYEIEVLDAQDVSLGGAPGAAKSAGPADVEKGLFGLLPREQLLRLASSLRSETEHPDSSQEWRGGDETMRRMRRFMPPFPGTGPRSAQDSGWRIVVRHPEGSLDAAVERAHLRNLGVSFAVLALLGVTAVALLVWVRRSQLLADRQLELVAGVSHELRTPVAGIRSLAQNLADGLVTEPSRVREYGRGIENEGARLVDMVEQVLARAGILSRHGEAPAEEIDVRQVLELAITDCRDRLDSSSATVLIEQPGSLPVLLGDRAGLQRALRNLVENAAIHGGEGEILVRALARTARGRRELVLSVEDEGPGIPEDELASVFDAFYRGRDARARQSTGSGLGLSLVREFATLSGGRVTVANRAQGGAVFSLHLPLQVSKT